MSKNKIFLPCHSSVKWSDPGDFLRAQFVVFRCQKYVKMRKWIYLVILKSVLGRSIYTTNVEEKITDDDDNEVDNPKYDANKVGKNKTGVVIPLKYLSNF